LTCGECLIVEDNAYGVRAAEAAVAHMRVVRSPREVTHENIMMRIGQLEAGAHVGQASRLLV
jgi:beta-phosphoglucomutase